MTAYAELQDLVVEQTKRPDIGAITSSAIRSATLRAHHVDFFPRDLAEQTLTYTPSSSVTDYSFPAVSNTLVRNRSIKKIFGIDNVTFAQLESLEYRELDDLYDSDNVRRLSTYSLIGDTLRIHPQRATGAISVAYYANPDLISATFSSWIADLYPDQVAQWASAIVFARTGYAEMARDFQQSYVTPFKELLISSHLLASVN